MQTERRRCTHCGSEYSYQISGYGCQYEVNDEDYCPDCKKVILNALSNVPKKFTNKWKEIPYDEKLVQGFNSLKKDEEERDTVLFSVLIGVNLDFDCIELYYYGHKRYALCKNKEDKDWKIFLESEFDLYKNDFTGKVWTDARLRNSDTYRKGCNFLRALENVPAHECKESGISKPLGGVHWQDFGFMFNSLK